MFYYRDSLEAVKALLGDPTLAENMVYAPSRLYVQDETQNRRILTEMWTGDWWWELQVRVVSRRLLKLKCLCRRSFLERR